LAGVVAAVALIALAGQSFAHARVQRLRGEARAVGIRMQLHRDLAETVRAAGGAGAVRALGWSTTNRALQTRLAWELGVPMELTESLTDYRVIFRSWREPLVGRVYMTGRARHRQTLARVGSFRVYRRDGITFPIARRE
jgi:tryptophan 2,3-dioxygenase